MLAHISRIPSLASLLCALLLLSGCAKDIPAFVPPSERSVHNFQQPWQENTFLSLAYHDVEDTDPDQTYVSVSTEHLIEQFAWLRENGYQPVTVDQILAASKGGKPLPPRALLLTFDDGYRSFYTRVFPLLKAYNWPAVLAPVSSWIDTPEDQSVDFGGKPTDRERFLTWRQIREVSRSGLVEIGAHTDALHYGILANPQGNLEPAAASRAYDPATDTYETDEAYRARIAADVDRVTAKILKVTGKKPRVWVWPYGEASGDALKIVQSKGYSMVLTLDSGLGKVNDLSNVPRVLVANDPQLQNFARISMVMENNTVMRVAHVDLDYVYDPDPEQMERNLGELVQRIADMRITTVFLQAFADPEGDGLVKSVYFPNRHLPMRANLFNRAAWQLRSRAMVDVYAWMPVLSFDLDPSLARVTSWDPKQGTAAVNPDQYRRLSPFDPKARRQIIDLYEDLARHAIFAGILFHDDALLSDFEDASPQALAAYREAGLPGSIEALRADPDTLHRWTRFKSRYLVDFTKVLADHVRAIRGPQVRTARNIYAQPVLHPESEAWFAQNLDDFLAAYDWTAPMAMPWMENVPHDGADAWLDSLVDAVASRPGALNKTVFEVQGRDWRPSKSNGDSGHVDSAVMAHWMKRLQLHGARSFGYYPDDFTQNQPRLDVIRPAISNAWYPFQ
ncbi:poly-beta-1,6-N-acetyl-D-glucosamine N-deacetylase PgaB [Pollutimonas sp. M17]|uniref:poly-beta-1,6-N-acetyl-D-glucosamine N-deacetylase PgaB n=1 Tax=Pollutimonas sp. M17 TaxID=2962065 RepID=UPI0021F46CAF|nr:poly-beta-1,6-N-acetyl-D-glucosamine N-deacetylase PgaB [Pollutimonas sp. M17]UYO92211.1 poly-beta-1,6-N-acetyl-D-glucosamine N-deacetylase PgaB [Pollutimonas sp. M17]